MPRVDGTLTALGDGCRGAEVLPARPLQRLDARVVDVVQICGWIGVQKVSGSRGVGGRSGISTGV
jgi:hypothetical protein